MDYNTLPACTVYVKRLDPERLNTEQQIEALRERLRLIATELGAEPLDVIVKRSLERKGQAFIVYSNPTDALEAKDTLDGFQFVPGGRNIICELARTPSDAVVERFCSKEVFDEHVRRRKAEKERKKAAAAEQQKAKKRTAPEPEPVVANRPLKGLKSTAKTTVVPDEYLPPNNTLFVREIPDDYDEESLTGLFSRYTGFKEVRMVTIGRFAGSAFVEYEANEGAISAREALNGRQLSNKVLKVTYQKTG